MIQARAAVKKCRKLICRSLEAKSTEIMVGRSGQKGVDTQECHLPSQEKRRTEVHCA
jgi:hypothetical protein